MNAQGAQWDCRCIPVNAQGDQWDCTVSGDGPGVQRDCVGVFMCVDVGGLGCGLVLLHCILYIIYCILYILYSTFHISTFLYSMFYIWYVVVVSLLIQLNPRA